MKVRFVLNGAGGELDRKEIEITEEEEIAGELASWIESAAISPGDWIKVEEV